MFKKEHPKRKCFLNNNAYRGRTNLRNGESSVRMGERLHPWDNLGNVKNLFSYGLLGSLCRKEIPVQGGGLVYQMPM